MTEWEPGTDAEVAMREALRTDDQESYFRILAGVDLLLPVSADALAGLVPLGWGTWSTGGRTHVLAFTSPSALQACLAEYAGSARRVAYQELANTWPNLEWWLAVNPGLPIEGYLPAWFVAQLARGDLRLPIRGADRDGAGSQNEPTAAPGQVSADGVGQAGSDAESQPATVSAGASAQIGPGVLPTHPPGPVLPSGLPARVPAAQAPGAVPPSVPPSSVVPAAYRPPEIVPADSAPGTREGAGPRRLGAAAAFSAPPVQHPSAPDRSTPDRSAPDPGAPISTRGLPRRPVTPPSERPTSMAAAAQAIADARTAHPPAATPAARLAPPVIPGAAGAGAPLRDPASDAPPVVPAPPDRSTPQPTQPGGAVPEFGRGYGPPPEEPRLQPSPPENPAGRPDVDEFVPANEVEQDLYGAAAEDSTDVFLSTLLLATVQVPVAPGSRPGSAPGEPGFAYRTEDAGGETFLVVFTSPDRLAEHHAEPIQTAGIRFVDLIRNWPDPSWSFSVNPGSPVGAKLPGAQIIALASWAAEAGLGGDYPDAEQPPAESPAPTRAPAPQSGVDLAQQPTIMQKTVPAEQVGYFLDRGYDRVSGFVHRANEVEHLRTPADLHAALGLGYAGSPYQADAKETFVLRWPAYRPSLYRIPYGGQNDQALRAMDGWVIERPPFRGNGFAPGEGRDVIAEFKVDSARLPHGAQLVRIDADGTEQTIATFDCDAPTWRQAGEH